MDFYSKWSPHAINWIPRLYKPNPFYYNVNAEKLCNAVGKLCNTVGKRFISCQKNSPLNWGSRKRLWPTYYIITTLNLYIIILTGSFSITVAQLTVCYQTYHGPPFIWLPSLAYTYCINFISSHHTCQGCHWNHDFPALISRGPVPLECLIAVPLICPSVRSHSAFALYVSSLWHLFSIHSSPDVSIYSAETKLFRDFWLKNIGSQGWSGKISWQVRTPLPPPPSSSPPRPNFYNNEDCVMKVSVSNSV